MSGKQIRAFTIMELLVTMLVSTIVLSLAFGVYYFAVRYSDLISNRANRDVTMLELEWLMKSDLSNSANHKLSRNEMIIYLPSGDSIFYQTGQISRRIRNMDTTEFFVKSELVRSNTNNLAVCIQQDGLSNCFRFRVFPESVSNYNQQK